MDILNALSVGTVVKLKKADKKISVIGIMQQFETEQGSQIFDYIGVPYPEGYLGASNTVLFQESDIELIYAVGYSDLERRTFISAMSERIKALKEILNKQS